MAVFVLTFSLVPLYRIACEKVFGIRLEQGPGEAAAVAAAKARRTVTVQFDGGVNSKLPWAFQPEQLTMQVVPGELNEAMYFARNDGDRAIVGSATPSVAPARASGYFTKTECFCFTAQTLQPGEKRDMPVRFIVDADLPDEQALRRRDVRIPRPDDDVHARNALGPVGHCGHGLRSADGVDLGQPEERARREDDRVRQARCRWR